MGNIQSILSKRVKTLFSMFKGNKKASLAILGLDATGKSTLVNLFRDTNMPTVPTLGFNVEEVVICNTTIKVWDVGGQKEFISYWNDYVKDVNGLVFMVDIADEDRFGAALEAFEGVVSHLRANLPVLLLLNKVDLVKNKELLNKKIATIKSLFKTESRTGGGNSYIMLHEKIFKNRVMPTSVKDDMAKMTNTGNSWSLDDSTVYPGFKWLLDEIKNSEYASN